MEQTTTGKAPPPIAIPSGGGIQILNMRGPAGIGATVVPQPGSAQTATVVGSPGPPGKGGGVGPRMISFTPQMLANASRPGQPSEASDDDDDADSVNQCDDVNNFSPCSPSSCSGDLNHQPVLKTTNNTTTKANNKFAPSSPPHCCLSPSASITGVSSSDLQQQPSENVDKLVVIEKDNASLVRSNKVLLDNHFEENGRCNDLSSLNVPVTTTAISTSNNYNNEPPESQSVSSSALCSPSSSIATNERSVSLTTTPTPTPQDSQLTFSSSPSNLPTPPPNVSPHGMGDEEEEDIELEGEEDDTFDDSRISELEHELMDCSDEDVDEEEQVVCKGDVVTSCVISTTGGDLDKCCNDKQDLGDKSPDSFIVKDKSIDGAQLDSVFESGEKCNYTRETNVPIRKDSPPAKESEYTKEKTPTPPQSPGPGDGDNNGSSNSRESTSDNLGALNNSYRSGDDQDNFSASQSCVQQMENDKSNSGVIVPVNSDNCDNSLENVEQQFGGQTEEIVGGDNNSCNTFVEEVACETVSISGVEPAAEVELEEEPPPLVNQEICCGAEKSMGRDKQVESVVVEDIHEEEEIFEEGDTSVDDLNLDMFSDSGVAEPEDVEMTSSRAASEPASVGEKVGGESKSLNDAQSPGLAVGGDAGSDKEKESVQTESNPLKINGIREEVVETGGEREEDDDHRPKIMDMNLADFIFMDDEIQAMEEGPPSSQAISPSSTSDGSNHPPPWNHLGSRPAAVPITTAPAPTSHSMEHPFSPPKIINDLFSSHPRVIDTTSSRSLETFPPSTTYWNDNKSKGIPQPQQSPPSCAFQMSLPSQNPRYPQNFPQTPTSSYSHPQNPSTRPIYPTNHTNSSTYPSTTRASSIHNNNNVSPLEQYKAHQQQYQPTPTSHSQQQQQPSQSQQRCFTNDPQLYSQFLEYTQNQYPVGQSHQQQQEHNSSKEPAKISAAAAAALARGQYAHVPATQQLQPLHQSQSQDHHLHAQQHQHSNANKIQRPAVIIPQQHSIRQANPTGAASSVLAQQRQYSPLSSQYPNSASFQSQYRSNVNTNVNGCDNTSTSSNSSQNPKTVYGMPQHQQQINLFRHAHHHGHNQQQQVMGNVRPMGPAGPTSTYYPRPSTNYPITSTASSTLIQLQPVSRQQLSQQQMQYQPKELQSCSYANVPGGGSRVPGSQQHQHRAYNPASQPNYTGSTGNPGNVPYAGTSFPGYGNPSSGSHSRMPYPQQQQYSSQPAVRPAMASASSSSQISLGSGSSKAGGGTMPPAGWNPPLLQGARAQLLQVLRPGAFSNQNLPGNRMPYSSGASSQQAYRPSSQNPAMSMAHQQHRTSSVIAPSRYPSSPSSSGAVVSQHHQQQPHHPDLVGGTGANQPRPVAMPTSTMTSPQMLSRSHAHLAHQHHHHPYNRPAVPMGTATSMSSDHGPYQQHTSALSSSSGAFNQQSSVIRPNVGYTSASQTASATKSSNSSRVYYSGNQGANPYFNNQASVIRGPPGSSAPSDCTINRNSSSSCIVIERGQHQPPTEGSVASGGYHPQQQQQHQVNSGEMTLQSFLSHPNAPFLCSSPGSAGSGGSLGPERSSSSGAGYEGWAYSHGPRPGLDPSSSSDSYMMSSSEYSADGGMMLRRFDAPLTLQSLQALSGLPPGANHLLVKTENGQFQLVSVRMQSPTAAAAAPPGTPPVIPSTVAALPPTSLSLAQQQQQNSPLVVAPPIPPHSPCPPPSSIITTTTIPTHPSQSAQQQQQQQQGRIITSSSSNHIVTSWSSSNNNSLVNNSNSTASLPPSVISAGPAPSLHLGPGPPAVGVGPSPVPIIAPPPPIHAPNPSSVPSSVIMPPPSSSSSHPPPPPSNSQLLISTANNNISSSSTSSYSTAAQSAVSAVIDLYHQHRTAATASGASVVMGPPGGSSRPPQPSPVITNSIPGPVPNSLPPGATVIRSAGGGAVGLPPPPPPIVVTSSNAAAAAAVAAVANSIISSSTNPTHSSGVSNSPASFRTPALPTTPQQPSSNATAAAAAVSSVPNNNASNNAQQSSANFGMMNAGVAHAAGGSSGSVSPSLSPNSNLSVVSPSLQQQHNNQYHHHHHSNHLYQTTSTYHPPSSPALGPVGPYQQHQQYHSASSYHSSNSIVNSTNTTANSVSQMSNETAKTKCKNFLSFLLELSAKQNQTVARNVKNLIQGLIDGKVNEENFADRLQKEVNSQPQPCLVGFLKKSLPHLRHSLAVNELKIEGIKPPPLATLVPPAPVSALVPQSTPPPPPEPTSRKKGAGKQTASVRPTTPTQPVSPSPVRILSGAPPPIVNSASASTTQPTILSVSASSSGGTPTPSLNTAPSPTSTKTSKSSKGSLSKSKSSSSSNSSSASGGSTGGSGPTGTPSSKSSIPAGSKVAQGKEKKDKQFSSSGYSADDDINDVAAMGGVNLAEETQRIMGSTEYVGTQIRSCRDETLIPASPISAKFKGIAAKFGLEESPGSDLSALLSHAVEERLKNMIEQLSVIAEHRMDVIKLDERYEITQDVKGQLRFLEELDKLEKKRHDEQEREMLIRAAKSRSKSEDPEQAKLKAKAKEMQRVALEEMRQRDANFTALQAIGPRKKPRIDTGGGSHGSAMPSTMGASGASNSLGRPQMPLRPRLKRVNLRDLLFLLEHDKETIRSPFLYKNLLLK